MNPDFLRCRDYLLAHRTDYATAYQQFQWPSLDRFNWALDYFDPMARDNAATGLWIVEDDGSESKLSFAEFSRRSNQAANFLRRLGVQRGDHVLVMMGNQAPLWITLLASFKLGAVVIPASTLVSPEDLQDRVERGEVRHVVAEEAQTSKFAALAGGFTRIAVGADVPGWTNLEEASREAAEFAPDGVTHATDPLLLYFTSGTTAKPKLVQHSHQSYPVGHLSTMFWIGIQPGDIHWNISSPGWAKHAWSCFFAPWNAGATVFVYNYTRFRAPDVLRVLAEHPVTTLCAPPTVWRMLIQERLTDYRVHLREAVSAGEPLNPEVIEQVQSAWGVTIRDGYGQTESTAMIGNPPGQTLVAGTMGRPMPGYRVRFSEEDSDEGEICIELSPRPIGLMTGYRNGPDVFAGGVYRTGDVAHRNGDGTFTYVGRADDVFKSSDYRISPFELESALIEHPAVAEAAVVPSPDAVRGCVPKAFVVLATGFEPSTELARELLLFARENLAPYKRIRRLAFAELPKTISGKIRRAELRKLEEARTDALVSAEFREEDLG